MSDWRAKGILAAAMSALLAHGNVGEALKISRFLHHRKRRKTSPEQARLRKLRARAHRRVAHESRRINRRITRGMLV